MNRRTIIAFFLLILFGIVAIGGMFLFSDKIVVLSPQGMIGDKQKTLMLVATLLMLFVVVPTFILTFYIAWKYRATNAKAKYHPNWDYNFWAEALWWGIPFVIISILGVITWKSCHELDPFKPIASDKKPVTIQVVALQWKWLFIYPDENIATINYIQFPTDTPVNFEITADAPMNSFWIPQLGGQVYAMTGMRSKLHLIADREGIFRGSSANISGEGFSGMIFTARATSQESFNAWVAEVRQSEPLTQEVYNRLVTPSENNPVATYTLGDKNLFHEIIYKYMPM